MIKFELKYEPYPPHQELIDCEWLSSWNSHAHNFGSWDRNINNAPKFIGGNGLCTFQGFWIWPMNFMEVWGKCGVLQ